jgi:hypothetical protein
MRSLSTDSLMARLEGGDKAVWMKIEDGTLIVGFDDGTTQATPITGVPTGPNADTAARALVALCIRACKFESSEAAAKVFLNGLPDLPGGQGFSGGLYPRPEGTDASARSRPSRGRPAKNSRVGD